jgi:hypothetical protein
MGHPIQKLINKLRYEWLSLRWWVKRKSEQFFMWLAWSMPREMAYWTFIRVSTHQYSGSPDARTVEQALKAWDLHCRPK